MDMLRVFNFRMLEVILSCVVSLSFGCAFILPCFLSEKASAVSLLADVVCVKYEKHVDVYSIDRDWVSCLLLEWRCGIYIVLLVLGYVDFYRACGFVEGCAECLLNVL